MTESDEETAESSTTSTPVFDLPDVMPQGNVLYDHYLGTGYGLSELGIVYDETYWAGRIRVAGDAIR